MLYRFLDFIGRQEDIIVLLENQCICLKQYYQTEQKYPSSTDSFEDAVNLYMGNPVETYDTSGFWGTMLEWMVIMDQEKLCDQLKLFLKDDLKEVTKCVWFLRADEERLFYDPNAMRLAGEGISLKAEDSFEELKEKVEFVLKQYENEYFSFDEYSFEPLEFIVCRYYGYLPRVKLK